MKKPILLLALCLSFAVVFTSCKGEKKEEHVEETEVHESQAADKADIAMNNAYQCPMDCEEGKTYEAEGKCPVCEMALKKVEAKEGEGNDNDTDDDGDKKEHEGESEDEHN